ncbi:hypothetical protein [Blastomonas sp. CCH8-A3]|uniref:hypothetical protein n=1 Tax=Blastomonas sp. CCH8-A3 TaxID=1768743 RepID=UPI000824472A|nr:hypothetical protein [Blastomonas sp. CCH8-A3]
MAGKIEKERAAIRDEELKLAERKKRLAEREAEERASAMTKSVLSKLDSDRLEALLSRMKALGIEEVEKRLLA